MFTISTYLCSSSWGSWLVTSNSWRPWLNLCGPDSCVDLTGGTAGPDLKESSDSFSTSFNAVLRRLLALSHGSDMLQTYSWTNAHVASCTVLYCLEYKGRRLTFVLLWHFIGDDSYRLWPLACSFWLLAWRFIPLAWDTACMTMHTPCRLHAWLLCMTIHTACMREVWLACSFWPLAWRFIPLACSFWPLAWGRYDFGTKNTPEHCHFCRKIEFSLDPSPSTEKRAW